MGIVTVIAEKCIKCVAKPVGDQLGYLIFYKSNVDKLKTSVQKLKVELSEKKLLVEEAGRNGENTSPLVQKWIEEAIDNIANAEELIRSEAQGEGRCLKWPFPNLRSRHELSREAKRMAHVVSDTVSEGKFDRVSYRAPPQMTVPPSTRDHDALWSRMSTLDAIKHALRDPDISMIGVYGMGGVGKTTLVKELAWQAEKEGSFGVVVMVTITRTLDLRRIQGELADGLGLKLQYEREEGRAEELRGRINEENSILVILDGIWGELDLTKLGVPCGDEHKGCKLVLTARDLDVLNMMGTQRDFTLGVLSEEESWNLFEKMAGNVARYHSIKPIAVEVAKCCFGLPLLIVTVAKALRKKEDVRAWKDSLKRLEKFDPTSFHKSVHDSLEFSYDCLETEELKSLFFLIGSFEHCFDTLDSSFNSEEPLEELLPICWGLGLYKDVHTLAEARNRHQILVNDLRASSLLLDGEMKRVRMHDLVRDMAESIASRTHPTYAVQEFTDINEWPNKDQLQKYHHIILPRYHISELPENLECPELKLFLLRFTAEDYLNLPDNLFSGMREVKVLHFVCINLTKPPPSSLRLLANLRSLHLSGKLEDIAIMGELKSLEILILGDWDIIELPKEIGHLTQLRLLNVSSCRSLRLIPKNLLSSLECLEELYMAGCTIEWEVEGSNSHNNNASLGELKNLHRLTTLELTIKDGSILPRDLHNFANLERYNITIGSERRDWDRDWSISRSLYLRGASIAYILENDGVKLLLTIVEKLYLDELKCVEDILPGLNGDGFMELRHLRIRDSAALLRVIISSDSNHLCHAFPNLKSLELRNLHNIKEICHGPLPTRCFDVLKVIRVEKCNKLKNLLLSSHVRHLSQLRRMEISECQSMKEVIAEEIHERENIMLPKLRYLSLKSLPNLLSFCSVPMTTGIGFVPLALIDKKVAMPNLETMELSGINACRIWDDNLPSHSCIQNLTRLTVGQCGNLTSLFPSSVARALVKLRNLQIISCQTLEQIFVQEKNLGNHNSSLNPLSSKEVILPNLKTLEIANLGNLKLLWHNQLAQYSFYKLNEMKTMLCPKLLNVFPSYMLNKLQNLETLEVRGCYELGVIFEIQELSTVATNQQGLPSRLRTLKLSSLPKLKCIWSKDPHGILKFQNLCKMNVFGCGSLDHVFPISVAEELQQLKVLQISQCGIENIVEKSDPGQIKRVYIETLYLSGCHRLKTIVPSSVAFHALGQLSVFGCDGVVNIMTSSAATGLSKLSSLTIICCEMIEEIVASENDGDAASDIVFMKLEELYLYSLSRLKSFCSRRYSFKFPSLRAVHVAECPMMETFCNGNLATPSLKKLSPSSGEDRWDGDLNTTIGNIFNEKAGLRS